MEDHVIWPIHFFFYINYCNENKENFIVKAIQTYTKFPINVCSAIWPIYVLFSIPYTESTWIYVKLIRQGRYH